MRETVHSTRRHALEAQSNINLLRSSCLNINDKPFNFRLIDFIKRIHPVLLCCRSFKAQHSTIAKNTDTNKYRNEQARSIFGNHIALYKSIVFRGIRFTTVTYQTLRRQTDSCVLYKVAAKLRVGFITSIVKTSENYNEYIVQVRDAPLKQYLSINLNGELITCSHVTFSNSQQTNNSFFVRPNNILEKLAYVFDNKSKYFIFFRFPNMIESS